MKLKYYLRGFGTGVLFATVVLMITFGIKKSLGSGNDSAGSENLPEETTTVLNADESSVNPEMTSQDQSGPEEPGTDVTQENTEEVTTDAPPEPDTTTPEPDITIPEPDTTTLELDTTASEPEPDTTEDSGDREMVTFVITSGMISNTAADLLEELGVVESGYDFNMYLYNNGYESKLRVGTYEIPKGASYEEITRIITGGR